nr:hypothetical protein DUIYXGZE_DUIYXGZE_CDS_0006 [Microvirus sp.]
MSRERMSHIVDKKIFSNTAVTTRKMNLDPISFRGGIRL